MTNYKPFDLDAAKRGDPVVTRDGRKTEYLFTLNSQDHLRHVFKVTDNNGSESIICVSCQGVLMLDSKIMTPCDLFMSEPAVPEGFIKYDPNVPPPEDAETLRMFYNSHGSMDEEVDFFFGDWKTFNHYGRQRTHYRVTRWKIPDGYSRYSVGDPIPDAYMVESVVVLHGLTYQEKETLDFMPHDECWKHVWGFKRVIAYRLKAEKPAVPEGYIRHDGSSICPVDRDNYGHNISWIDRLGVKNQTTVRDLNWDDNVIAYKITHVPEPSIDEVIERIAYLWACKGEDEKVLIDLLTKFHASCKGD